MLTVDGFSKDDENMLIHCAREFSSALSLVERQGRSERINDTFCQLYHDVDLATVGGGSAKERSEALTSSNLKSGVIDVSDFGKHLIEVEAVIRQLLVAEHVFIWVRIIRLRLATFFENKRQQHWADTTGVVMEVGGSSMLQMYTTLGSN